MEVENKVNVRNESQIPIDEVDTENTKMEVQIENIQIGKWYCLIGVTENAWSHEGYRYLDTNKERVLRPIERVTDEFVVTACSRKFRRKGLKVETVSFETYTE